MKALLVRELPKGPGWRYELKLDGVRALGIKNGRRVSLVSRSGNELGAKYPEILQELRHLPVRQAVLDGEIVALDPQGRPSFQLLQSFQNEARKPPLRYFVFDLLNLNGKDLTRLPLEQRTELAQSLVSGNGRFCFSMSFEGNSSGTLKELRSRGLEGIVAKRKDSSYEPGRRSGAWVKFKWSNEQEFVIGGYTQPQGTRSYFGALLVGYYERQQLRFAGKVGTGFDQRWLATLYRKFQALIRPDCPFQNVPEDLPGAAKGLTRSAMRLCTWLEPQLVCQIRFAEWTRDGHLRQPAFLGLRDDKKPNEVVRETA